MQVYITNGRNYLHTLMTTPKLAWYLDKNVNPWKSQSILLAVSSLPKIRMPILLQLFLLLLLDFLVSVLYLWQARTHLRQFLPWEQQSLQLTTEVCVAANGCSSKLLSFVLPQVRLSESLRRQRAAHPCLACAAGAWATQTFSYSLFHRQEGDSH